MSKINFVEALEKVLGEEDVEALEKGELHIAYDYVADKNPEEVR